MQEERRGQETAVSAVSVGLPELGLVGVATRRLTGRIVKYQSILEHNPDASIWNRPQDSSGSFRDASRPTISLSSGS